METHPICHNEILGTSGVSYLRQLCLMSNAAWNHQKGEIWLQIESLVKDLNVVIDHSLQEQIHMDIQELQKLIRLGKAFGKDRYHSPTSWDGYWCSALQSQITMFSIQNTTNRAHLLVTNVDFSCRTALPLTQAIRMGASCFALAG